LSTGRRLLYRPDDVGSRYLAIDLGAESGRAMLGELAAGRVALTEVRRFPNEPVRDASGLHWDALRLWLEITRALEAASGSTLDGIGVDTWGCDFALIGEAGTLLGNPYHYRDERTDGVLDAVAERVGRDVLYARTGTQLMPFNTLFQVYAARRMAPKVIDAATALLMMPDLFNFWMTGELRTEYTIASTSQMADPRARSWATALLDQLELPRRLLQPIVEPGTRIGALRASVCPALAGTTVIAPACHDTGSAFAAVATDGRGAVLSSGTWSLLGAELDQPVVTERARELNFTNEGGVCGTTRVLKNITGMWLLQGCVRAWAAAGHSSSYDGLLAEAADERFGFRSLFDPDHRDFFHPPDMPGAIAGFCRRTGQPAPDHPGAFTRAILESLALKYRVVLESLEALTGRRFEHLRIVGGGARNRLLSQFTADAIGRPVVAGPVEATALGNIAMQMVATGTVGSLPDARGLIEHSFPAERFDPRSAGRWDAEYARFLEYLGT
jgi:rhamnulokinase